MSVEMPSRFYHNNVSTNLGGGPLRVITLIVVSVISDFA